MTRLRLMLLVVALALGASGAAPGRAAQAGPPEGFHQPLDALLDAYVRDGFVYYGALKSDRARLDRYVASLGGAAAARVADWPAADQEAFWINAYDALVLRTVIDHYPIRGRAPQYPPGSIRQIPGAFDRTVWRVGGRSLTLDAIENQPLAPFADPRAYLALGRGAAGSGRLRSEAYAGDRLEGQLAGVAEEFDGHAQMLHIDQPARRVSVTSIIGWHEAVFVQAYADKAPADLATRSPIERAAVALIWPGLLPHEREFLSRNDFTLTYLAFDWRLNDLAGRWR